VQFAGLIPGHYGAILADPPWSFKPWGGKHGTPHRTANDHYVTQSAEWLTDLPVASLAAKDCALFMWVVDSHLDVALSLGASWGFQIKTKAFTWLKTKPSGEGYRIGMGYWTRKQSEICLLFTKGAPKRLSMGVREVIEEPRREHSRKPDETYDRIEALVGGPYCELFARRTRPGWHSWGNEIPAAESARRQMTEALRAFGV
jgi:N6-adenosine-specific RNA methylase IME4